jgi:hypothetical protein
MENREMNAFEKVMDNMFAFSIGALFILLLMCVFQSEDHKETSSWIMNHEVKKHLEIPKDPTIETIKYNGQLVWPREIKVTNYDNYSTIELVKPKEQLAPIAGRITSIECRLDNLEMWIADE